jgi:cysteinyl-tRNA synthetase, unknown class
MKSIMPTLATRSLPLVIALLGVLGVCCALAGSEGSRLSDVKSWAFQLQNVDPLEIKFSPYDVVVLDYGFDRRNATAFPREVVDMMRKRANGKRRPMFAYMSIGEAETYRYYWQDSWLTNRPEWLEPENPDWPGNFLVQFWHPGWQELIYGSPNAYLDRILDAGFDGVYLDGVDKFEQWQRTRPGAGDAMVDFITGIATYARTLRKDFMVIPQNGDRLLGNLQFRNIIDGFAREDLLYSEHEPEARNAPQSIAEATERLKWVADAGKPVFVVEYTANAALAHDMLREIHELGFIGYVTKRDLRSLSPPVFGCGQPDCSQ